jgi:Kef-type K+ transport system membrane component KefB
VLFPLRTTDTSQPVTLFIIQLIIIIAFTQGLGWCFKFINQPKVIAEVIGGIILGKTAFGRIPGFSEHIFPDASIPYLNLVANIGLIIFLFLVGLEVDIGVIKRTGRKAALVSVVGMVLPFGLGAAVAVPVYNKYIHNNPSLGTDVTFGHFLLFIGVSMSITAFPVLCRILTATKLLDTEVGVVVLSAGVGNDVVGWVLLALTLALTSPGAKGESSVYILLAAVGWSLVLLWPIKKAYVWLVRRSGSLENGPTPSIMVITLMIVFTSAFMTGIIGVHPIFGGFLAGLIIPHEGGFAIHLTERIEDLVNMLFIPIYFVLSGLKTDLTKLNTGIMWGYIVMLTVVAWAGKFVGCAGVARIMGYTWRESGAIGMLMSCKGLVELIVLNVGLDAGIIGQDVFSMLVFVAVVLTFITTPCTLWIYPRRFHTRISQAQATQAGAEKDKVAFLNNSNGAAGGREYTSRLLVVLQRLEHLAPVMFITQMLEPASALGAAAPAPPLETKHDSKDRDAESEFDGSDAPSVEATRNVHVDALKLMELTGRTYSVMQSTEKDQLLLTDDALQLYKQFGRLRGVDVTPHLSIVGENSFPSAVSDYAQELSSELVIVPWTVPYGDDLVANAESDKTGVTPAPAVPTPFHSVFAADGSTMYTHFIRNLYTTSMTDVAVFIDRGFAGGASGPGAGQHVFLPFFGGSDDRLALRLVVQLCHHTNVTATVLRFVHADLPDAASETASVREHTLPESAQVHRAAFISNQLTVGGAFDEQNRTQSETADNVAWGYYTSAEALPSAVQSRITFMARETSAPLADAAAAAEAEMNAARARRLWRPLLVVTGRGRKRAAYNHERELTTVLARLNQSPTVGAELRKTVGDVATGLILAGGQAAQASYFVCEAGL